MPGIQIFQAITKRASAVSGTYSFRVFLAYNVLLYGVFVALWYKVGKRDIKLPDDTDKMSLPLAMYIAALTHVSLNPPSEVVPKTARGRALVACHAVLSWSGLLIWASTWS